MADPLTIRYNNPGAIEYKPFLAQYGATVGPNGRYAMFPDRASGYKAMEGLLGTYQTKHKLNTVEGIVNRWAPPNVDNNSTSTYTQKVAQQLGVDPRASLDPSMTPRLAEAMASYEAGRPVPRGGAAPSQPSPMSSPTPQGATPVVNGVYDGLTPDDVTGRRAMAQRLMGEASSTAPVGHWTGALARALTGLNSSMFREEASAAEKKGQASTQGFMQAAMANPQGAAAAGMGNPWTAPVAQNIAGKVINQNLEQSSPAYQQQRQLMQGQIDMLPLQRQQAQGQIAGQALQQRVTQGQLEQLKSQTPEYRATVAEQYGLTKGTPAYNAFVISGQYSPDATKFQVIPEGASVLSENPRTGQARVIHQGAPKVDSTAKKAIFEAQDELPQIKSSLELLREAKDLLPQIYTGFGSGVRSTWNQGSSDMLPNVLSDPKRAQATQRFNQIMNLESINSMSQTLKGASTDKEMAAFVSIYNDPNVRTEVKQRALESILRRVEMHHQNKIDRIKELGGRMPSDVGNSATQDGWSARRLD